MSLPALRWLLVEYPELWALWLCLAAWLSLTLGSTGIMHAHGRMHTMVSPDGQSLSFPQLLGMVFSWALMVAAMMIPLQVGSLRRVAGRSLWFRRHRHVWLVLLGYAIPWIAVGVTADLIFNRIPERFALSLEIAALFVAALWQIVPLKRSALIRCYLEPVLAPTGGKGDRDCLVYGLRLAIRCGITCWALMLACLATQHPLWEMVLISAVVWMERMWPQVSLIWSAGILASVGGLLAYSGFKPQ
jgi:hypothetical protein